MNKGELIKMTARIFLLILILVFGIMAWKSSPNTTPSWVGIFGAALSLAFLIIVLVAGKRK